MRERSRGSFTKPVLTTRTTACNGVVTVSNSTPTGSIYTQGTVESISDVVTPGFRRISAEGGIVNSPVVISKEIRGFSLGPCSVTRTAACSGSTTKSVEYNGIRGDWDLPGYLMPPDTVITSAMTEAYTAMVASIDSPPVEGLVELAEAVSTIESLAEIVRSVYAIMRRLHSSADFHQWCRRRRRAPTVGELRNFLADQWLRYRYFFTPLYLSSRSLLKELLEKAPPPERQTYRSGVTWSDADSYVGGWVTGVDFRSRLSYTRTTSLSVRAGCLTQVVRGKCLTSTLGLRGQDIPNAAWELLPYSFAMDWFTNIGDFLSAVSPKVGRQSLCSWTTFGLTAVVDWEIENQALTTAGYTKTADSSRGLCTLQTKRRTPGGNVGITNRVFQGRWLDFTRLIDAHALLSRFV